MQKIKKGFIQNLLCFTVFLMSTLIWGCQQGPADSGVGTISPEGEFSASISESLEKHRSGLVLTASLVVDGRAAIPMNINLETDLVTAPPVEDLSPGLHTFEIHYFLGSILVAIDSVSVEIVGGKNTNITPDMFQLNLDLDEDGFSGIDEVIAGSDPNDLSSLPINPNGIIDSPVSNQTISLGSTVDFSGTASSGSGSPTFSYSWDFGGAAAGQSVEDPDPVVFDRLGTFTVTFTVRDSLNQEDLTPDTREITVVQNLLPKGTIDSPVSNQTIDFGSSLEFTGTADTSRGSPPFTYSWNFRGGAANQSIEDPGSVTFKTIGTYRVSFTVSDSLGQEDPTPETREITVVPNLPPVGTIDTPTSNQTIGLGDSVNFTGTASSSSGRVPFVYNWDFEGGASNQSIEDPGAVVFDVLGTFSVTLTVTDSLGQDDPTPEVREITVVPNNPPNGLIDQPATNTIILAGQSMAFFGSGFDLTGQLSLDFAWNFGGGASNSLLKDPGLTFFDTPGLYPVSLEVSNSLGLVDPTPDYRLVSVAADKTPLAARQIALGIYFSCAIVGEGTVKCWGLNEGGRLGQGHTLNRGDELGEMGDALLPVDLGFGRSARAIANSQNHVCALLDNGVVKCWGKNVYGTLGQGNTKILGDEPGEMGDNLLPIVLGSGRWALAITAGGSHSCALLDDASVKCWGANSWGQLGVGSNSIALGDEPGEMGDTLLAVPLGVGRSAQAISAGESHTCALLDDSSIKCWGRNSQGQLGQGDNNHRGDGPGEMGDNLAPIALGSGRSVVALGAGGDHTCALLDDASVKCWGLNSEGQLGQGDTGWRGDQPGEMGDSLLPIALGIDRLALEISVADGHNCVLLDDGSVKCWGSNSSGRLGHGDNNNHGDEPGEMGDWLLVADLGSGRTALGISTAYAHSCALLDDSNIKCWGYNVYGQLGQGDIQGRGDQPGEMGDNLLPIDLGTAHSTISLSAGAAHTCAVLGDGGVKCWGYNNGGELGHGDIKNRGDEPAEMGNLLSLTDLGSGRIARVLAVGNSHACALLDDASVKCWGRNGVGQLGQGDRNNRGNESNEMGDALFSIDLGSGRSVRVIVAGFAHSCVILDDDTVKCWGQNDFGQLGQGHTVTVGDDPGEMGDALPPINLGTGRSARAIAAGDNHSCVLLDDESLKCWGVNSEGQLGQGSTWSLGDTPGEMGDALLPIDLGAGRTARAITAGRAHSCALLDNGDVKCWGANFESQLGLGDTKTRGNGTVGSEMGDLLLPISLGTGRSALAISAGSNATCALLDDASIKCWGSNSEGQLARGDGVNYGGFPEEMGDALSPIDLGGGRTALGVTVGFAHTCAILDDASIKCWGSNSLGQLGLGDTRNRGDDSGEMGSQLSPIPLGIP